MAVHREGEINIDEVEIGNAELKFFRSDITPDGDNNKRNNMNRMNINVCGSEVEELYLM